MQQLTRTLSALFLGLAVLILAEARFAKLDALTSREPHGIRSLVATLAVHEQQRGGIERSLALDPENAAAWESRCISMDAPNAAERLADCRKASSLRTSAADEHAEGEAYEENNEPCAAAQAFQRALTRQGLHGQRSYYLRDQARAELACGDLPASLAALHDAETDDSVAAEQQADLPGPGSNVGRDGLSLDRGYMSVVYERMNQPEKAGRMCAAANPGYASCTCQLNGSWLRCTQSAPASQLAAR